MSAPVFLATVPLAAGGTVRLDGPEGRHAATVMRLRAGEPVELVDGAGTRATGTVAAVAKDAVEIAIDAVTREPEPQPRLVVVQALLKGEHGELAVDQLTQAGADVIVPWSSERSVVSVKGERTERAQARLALRALAAAKQARRARLPRVAGVTGLPGVLGLVGTAACAIVLHESASTPIDALALPAAGDLLLVIGPEGGLADAERQALAAAGAIEARLGPTVLRGSLAGAVAAGIVLSRTRWASVGGSPA